MSFDVAIDSVSPGLGRTFVLRPGGVAGNGVFLTWDAVYAHAKSIDNGPFTVIFDREFSNPQITTSAGESGGKWKVGGWTFQGTTAESGRKVQSQEGAALDINVPGSDFTEAIALTLDSIWLEHLGTNHLIHHDDVGPGSQAHVWMIRDARIESNAGAGLCLRGVGDQLLLIMKDGCSVRDGGAKAIGGGALSVQLWDNASILDNAIDGAISIINHFGQRAIPVGDLNTEPTSGLDIFVGRPMLTTAARTSALTAAQLLTLGDRLLRFDTSSAPIAQPLPTSTWEIAGVTVRLSKTTADANAASFAPDGGGDTIGGPASTTTQHGYIELLCNGDGSWTSMGSRP